MTSVRKIELEFSALRVPTLAAGEGDTVILLHGFPDIPATFSAQLEALVGSGLRAAAPALRGYAPGAQPSDGDYHVGALASDVIACADALDAKRFHLVGHDWGATIAYAAAALAPDRVASLTVLAVPHPARMAEVAMTSAEQQARYQYILDFQSPDAEARVAADDFAYLDDLWRRWSPGWDIPGEVIEEVRATFRQPGVLEAAIAYYRQALDFGSDAGRRAQELLSGPFRVPTLGLFGSEDGCILASTFEEAMRPGDFPAGLKIGRVDRAGHFLHRERPGEVNAELLAWVRRHPA